MVVRRRRLPPGRTLVKLSTRITEESKKEGELNVSRIRTDDGAPVFLSFSHYIQSAIIDFNRKCQVRFEDQLKGND